VGRCRHQLPLLLRPQDDVRQVLRGLHRSSRRLRHLDELFEAITLAQTRKVTSFPVVLVGRTYWQGLVDWLHHTVEADGNVSAADFAMLHITDDPAEAVRIVASRQRSAPEPADTQPPE
jgi:hypothetical protein